MSDIAQKTAIIIPCYNEEKRLPVESFSGFLQAHQDMLLLFVNDGSKDQTSAVLRKLTEKFPNAVSLDLQKNAGKAEAIRMGVYHLQDKFTGAYIGYFDADLSTPLSVSCEFSAFMQQHDGVDVIMGSRVRRLGTTIKRSWKRHLIGRVFASVASKLLHIPVYDSQCGAKLFRKEVACALFKDMFISRWLFDVELLFRYIKTFGRDKAVTRVYEMPLMHWEDSGGSRIKFLDFLIFPLELMKMYMKYNKA